MEEAYKIFLAEGQSQLAETAPDGCKMRSDSTSEVFGSNVFGNLSATSAARFSLTLH